jgi:hypothetical protein
MITITKSSPLSCITLPLARLLLRPLLWLKNLYGCWCSRSDANSQTATSQLGNVDHKWRRKIDTVLSSEDNVAIPRVPDAGRLDGGLITMHNGIQVSALGYYGGGILNMLVENKGVHEPQEERVFAVILGLLEPGATMIELGAYWGFYSLWFAKEVPDAHCHLVEPSYACMLSGKHNFKRASQDAVFTQAYVGSEEGLSLDGTDIICVDDYCRKHSLDKVEILHVDIQGAEEMMLKGAETMLKGKKVDYIFISTHSNGLHANCVQALKDHGYEILASANMDDSYSGDGLIVARSPLLTNPLSIEISHRTKRAQSA